jgi:hypothetical protein
MTVPEREEAMLSEETGEDEGGGRREMAACGRQRRNNA